MNITDFLEARISEAEELAKASIETEAPDEWDNPTETQNHWPANIAFWGSQTPYRVLAECAAKRALSNLHSPGDYRGQLTCNDCGDWWDGSPVDYPCNTIKIVAAIYKDHKDYEPEWALNG